MSRILFLSGWFPAPANNGSKIRILNLLRELSKKHELSLVSFADEPNANPNAVELYSICRDVQVVAPSQSEAGRRYTVSGLWSRTPRSLSAAYSTEMAARIKQTLAAKKYDVVIASQLTMASYKSCFGGLPALFEEVEVGVLYDQFIKASSLKQRVRYGMTWKKHRQYLAWLLRQYRACTVASEPERELVKSLLPESRTVQVIPNGLDLDAYADIPRTEQPNTLIFTGSFRYSANHDAMVWFLKEVYPEVTAQLPDVQLKITGDHANLELPTAKNVTRTGYVNDVRPLVASSCVSLAPLRVGGGTRLKILEAMALHTPVVATTKGAEGLAARNNEHLLIADTPDEFARAVIRLLQDSQLRRRLANNAYQLVQNKYDWAAVMPQFMHLIERITYN